MVNKFEDVLVSINNLKLGTKVSEVAPLVFIEKQHYDSIKIIAHNSEAIIRELETRDFFCDNLLVLLHDESIVDASHPIVQRWITLQGTKNVKNLAIRRSNVKYRSTFGISIDGTRSGIIGFFGPRKNVNDPPKPLATFGIVQSRSKMGSKLLEVVDTHYDEYSSDDQSVIILKNEKSEMV